MVNQKFPPEMLYRVRQTVEDRGFCVFGADDIDRLLSGIRGGQTAKRLALQEFAVLSGLRIETTPNLNAARFENPLAQKTMNLTLRSPLFPDATMHLREIEPGLFAYTCPRSGGIWVPLQSYLDWKSHCGPGDILWPTDPDPIPVDDHHPRALICPESGHLLIRYRVGHGLKFHVEVSPETGGIWLDHGEWEALKREGLHTELNVIFTAPYQRQIRAAEHQEAVERIFSGRIGNEDFGKVVEFKRWLATHPKRRDIRCYLFYDLKEEEE